MVIAWSFWIGVLSIITFIFWMLWRYARRIEEAEYEERQWRTYIDQLWQIDPPQAQYWQDQFEMKFLR